MRNFIHGLVEDYFNNKKYLRNVVIIEKSISIISLNYCEISSVVSQFLCICYLIYKNFFNFLIDNR